MHAAKTLGWAGATPLLGAFSRPKLRGSHPPAPSSSGPCFGRVQEWEQAVCSAICNASRMRKGAEILGTTQSTVETTEDYNSTGSPGGRSQTQPRQVRPVHRRERFLRRERGAQAPV